MSRFTTSDGLELYYEDTGDGLPLLCLAGLTRNARDFDFVAPHLDGVRMIRLDYRGRGQSDWAEDWTTYALPIEARDIFELLAHLSLEKVAVLGTSRGGLNAFGMAATAPDALLGVALNDVGPDIDTGGVAAIMTYLGRRPTATSHAELAQAMSAIQTDLKDVPLERWEKLARDNYPETSTGLALSYDPKLRDATALMIEKPALDLWPFFDALPNTPLTVIWGENSNLLKEPTVREMQRRRPDLILGRVPGRGHVPFLDEPESLAALGRWLEAMK